MNPPTQPAMQAAHTPRGPVLSMQDETRFLDAIAFYRYGYPFNEISELAQNQVMEEHRQMQSAPDLLAALEACDRGLAGMIDDAEGQAGTTTLNLTLAFDALNQARAAIARAKGGAL